MKSVNWYVKINSSNHTLNKSCAAYAIYFWKISVTSEYLFCQQIKCNYVYKIQSILSPDYAAADTEAAAPGEVSGHIFTAEWLSCIHHSQTRTCFFKCEQRDVRIWYVNKFIQ